jgi:hypothetical protein
MTIFVKYIKPDKHRVILIALVLATLFSTLLPANYSFAQSEQASCCVQDSEASSCCCSENVPENVSPNQVDCCSCDKLPSHSADLASAPSSKYVDENSSACINEYTLPLISADSAEEAIFQVKLNACRQKTTRLYLLNRALLI